MHCYFAQYTLIIELEVRMEQRVSLFVTSSPLQSLTLATKHWTLSLNIARQLIILLQKTEHSSNVKTVYSRSVERITIVVADGLELEDKIPITLWGATAAAVDKNVNAGDSIKMTAVILKYYQGALELNSTKDTLIFSIDDEFLDLIEIDTADRGIDASLISFDPKSVSCWPMCPGAVCRKKKVS